MLPFLKPRPQTGVIVKEFKTSSNSVQENHDEDHGLMTCAEDLIKAVHAKDAPAVKAALQAAFELLDSEPHEEGDHYDDLNEQAAADAEE